MSHILVVDDDKAIREAIGLILTLEGYEVVTAADNDEALEQIQNTSPCLILLDWMMPAGGGEQLLEKLQQQPARAPIPVVVFSAIAAARRRAAELGLECLPKPVDIDRLIDIAARHCGRAPRDSRISQPTETERKQTLRSDTAS